MLPECPDQTRCLHLVESVGATARTDGPYRRFPIGAREVGRTVVDRAPYVASARLAASGIADPVWLEVHQVRSFAAVPLMRGGDCKGVLALFSRRDLDAPEVALLALAASQASASSGAGRTAPLATIAPPRAPRANPPAAEPERRTLAEIEREAIERVLAQTHGRVSGPLGAAKILGLHPSTLASRMIKLGVRRPARK